MPSKAPCVPEVQFSKRTELLRVPSNNIVPLAPPPAHERHCMEPRGLLQQNSENPLQTISSGPACSQLLGKTLHESDARCCPGSSNSSLTGPELHDGTTQMDTSCPQATTMADFSRSSSRSHHCSLQGAQLLSAAVRPEARTFDAQVLTVPVDLQSWNCIELSVT